MDISDAATSTSNSPAHDMELGRPIGAVRLPNGTIAIAETGGTFVRLFDASGKALPIVGRDGDGPGEFRNISWIGQCGGDSVFAWDGDHERMSVISAKGKISREFPLTDPQFKHNAPFTLACSRTGTLATQGFRFPGPPSENHRIGRIPLPIVIYNMQTHAAATTPPVTGTEQFVMGSGSAPLPLGKATSFVVIDRRVFVDTGDSATIQAYDVQGKAASLVRLPLPVRATTAANFHRAVQEVTAQIQSAARQRITDSMMAIPRPNPAPPYGSLFADTDNLLWVTLSFEGDPQTHLRGFDTTGAPKGDLTLPSALLVYEIGHDYVLGMFEDADGEPHMVMYRFRRGS